MIRTSTKAFSVTTIGLFLTALAVTACSGGSTDPGGFGGADSNQTAGPGATKGGAGGGGTTTPTKPQPPGTSTPPSSSGDGGAPVSKPPTPSGTDGGTGSGMCASAADQDSCAQCCDPNNALATGEQAFGDCACQTPGTCKTECGDTFCANKQPSAACVTCLDGAQQCDQTAKTACDGNAACAAAGKCEDAAQCGQKPPKK